MHTRYLHRMLIGLTIATVVALIWHRYALDSVLIVDATSPFEIQAVDDSTSGGYSKSVLRREKGKLILECAINPGYKWPFCEIAIALKQPPAGIDLTRFETVRLWVNYEGPKPQQQVRFFIRNFNPAYSKVGDPVSLKVQEIVYDPSLYAQPLEVRLSQFSVSSWWTTERAIPIEYAGTEFNNVAVLEISTGGNVSPGMHRITVERIEFGGKVISPAGFRLVIIGIWLTSVMGYLLADGIITRRRLMLSNRKQSSLKRINEALRVQTKIFEKLASHDPLTGILNRKGLGDELFSLAEGQEEHLFPFSLVFIDIDHFKDINDQHGHGVGDQVIREIAYVIQGDIQRRDLFARWGGEEFLLICPLTRAPDAALLAERLRQIIASREWPGGIRVTSSFGVSELAVGEDLSEGIKRADQAMYRAKQNGRDRVEVQLDSGKTEDPPA